MSEKIKNPTIPSPIEGGFRIWEGVVEDINDPEQLGRVRVRVLGLHTENLDDIPTDTLPWAMTAQPTNSPSSGGIGSSGTGLLNGAFVILYFRDAPENQQPVILGSLLGMPIEKRPPDVGFQDPTGFLPREERLGESDVNRLARGEIKDTSIEDQNNTRDVGVVYPVASQQQKKQEALAEKNVEAGQSGTETPSQPTTAPTRDSIIEDMLDTIGLTMDDVEAMGLTPDVLKQFGLTDEQIKFLFGGETETITENPDDPENPIVEPKKLEVEYSPPDKNLQTWDEPASPYNAQYTYNKVYESQSGHTIEVDDSPNAERIRVWHRSGAMTEIHPDGTTIRRAMQSDYDIVGNDKKVSIKGDHQLSVGGSSNHMVTGKSVVLISGTHDVSVLGAANVHFYGKTTAYFGADVKADIIGSLNATVNQNLNASVVGKSAVIGADIAVDASNSFKIKTKEFGLDAETATIKTKETNIDAETFALKSTEVSVDGETMTFTGSTIDLDAFTTLYGDFTGTVLAEGTLLGVATFAFPIIDPDTPPAIIPSFVAEPPEAPESPSSPIAALIQPSAAEVYREDDYSDQVQLGAPDKTYRLPSSDPKGQAALGLPSDNAPIAKTNPTEENKTESAPVAPIPTAPEGTPPAPDGTPPIGCTVFENPLNPSNRLSKHITLGNLQLKGDVVKAQNGLTPAKIVCNLQKLSQQVLDKVIDQWGRPNITDGFRSIEVAKRIGSKPSSMHCYGTAADIQYSGKDEKFHYDVAVWIKENCPFAELILEYGGRAGPWIHVAYNDDPSNGARKSNNTKTVMTRVNAPADYDPGLKLLKNIPGKGGR